MGSSPFTGSIFKGRKVLQLRNCLRQTLFPCICPLCLEPVSHHVDDFLTNGICRKCYSDLETSLRGNFYCSVCGVPMTRGSFPGKMDVSGDVIPETLTPGRGLHTCPECHHKTFIWHGTYAVFQYQGKVRQLLLRLKYRRHEYLAPVLSTFILKSWNERGNFPQIDCICPVPMHCLREWLRGYNQTEILAETLARHLDVPLVKVLRRTRRIPSQTRLRQKDREKNQDNSMAVRRRYLNWVRDKRILLFDDVLTTGATLHEATTRLMQAGAKRVYVGVAARNIRS